MRKPPLGLLLIALIVISLVAATTMHLSGAQSSGTNVSGTLTSDTTWTAAESPYNFVGNVTVNSGVTLSIQPGVTVDFNGYYLRVNGTLNAQGVSNNKIVFDIPLEFTAFDDSPIQFESSSTSWNPQTDSGSIIENAIINSKACIPAIFIDSVSPKIELDTINSSGYYTDRYPCYGNSASMEIQGANSDPIIANNTIIGGIFAIGGLICNNTITIMSGAFGSALHLQGNTTVLGNKIYGSNVGINVDAYGANETFLIQSNLVIDNGIGLFLSPQINSDFCYIIKNNTFSDNALGISLNPDWEYPYFDSAPPAISGNIVIVYNNIFSNGGCNLETYYSSDSNVTFNWWGTTNATAIGQAIYDSKYNSALGTVNYTPFLNSSNPMAPAYISSSANPAPTSTPTTTSTTASTSTTQPTATAATSPTASPLMPNAPEFPSMLLLALFIVAITPAIVFILRKRGKA
jgi:hypothetical protein